MTDLPLAGRTIAVTRGEKRNDPLAVQLRELGARVVEVPSIAIAPPASYGPLDEALRDLSRFAWAVFASANGVERTLDRAAQLGITAERWRDVKLAAVGPATAERLALALRVPDLVPAEARGSALAAALAPVVAGRAVLVPRAEEGRPELVDGLRSAGAEVCAPTAYRTVPVEKEALQPLADALTRGEVDAIAFASPSAVRSVVGALGHDSRAILGRVVLAAIGPTTAGALREVGLHPAVEPATYTVPALAAALADLLAPTPRG
jgi:uroporphyrinogen-III synthase/uroporphyrinogen III methyltransferase/synthase